MVLFNSDVILTQTPTGIQTENYITVDAGVKVDI